MSKIDFLQILSIQRRKLNDEHQKPGWNSWALYGALASLSWLLISVISEKKYEIKTAVFIAIFFYISTYLINYLKNLLPNQRSQTKKSFILVKNEVANSILVELAYLITNIFLYLFLKRNCDFEYKAQSLLLDILIFTFVIAFLIYLLFLAINLPISTSVNSLPVKWTIVLSQILLVSTGLIILIKIFPLAFYHENIASVQLGLIIYSLHFIIIKLLKETERNLLLHQIDELIDDITFDKKTVQEGEDTLRFIVFGLHLKAILDPYISKYIDLTNKYLSTCNLLVDEIELYNLDKNPDRIGRIKNLGIGNESQINSLSKELIKSQEDINNKMIFYYLSEKDNPEYKAIKALLEDTQNKRLVNFENLKEKLGMYSFDIKD